MGLPQRYSDRSGGLRPPLAWLDQELAELDRRGLRRTVACRGGKQTAEIVLDGQRLANFGSNDYLGLAADPRLAAAAARAVEQEGWGSGASPLVTGFGPAHRALQERLASFEQTEAALLFSSGFAANTGTVATLVGSGDAIFSDRHNHASIIDGCRLSRAAVHIYAHGDPHDLAARLRAARQYRRRLIVTDGLFSMDGDLAPLAELAELADRYGAMLMVDEAHATGVVGRGGRGAAEALGVEHRIDVRVGTLSKALGSAGGFVCGRRSLVQWLTNQARSYFFSTAPPPAASAAASAALDIVQQEPQRRRRLLERAAELRRKLGQQGWQLGPSQAQIVPVVVGAADRAMQLAAALRQRGLFVPAIRPPSVPAGGALLRISLSAAHAPKMLERLTQAFQQLA